MKFLSDKIVVISFRFETQFVVTFSIEITRHIREHAHWPSPFPLILGNWEVLRFIPNFSSEIFSILRIFLTSIAYQSSGKFTWDRPNFATLPARILDLHLQKLHCHILHIRFHKSKNPEENHNRTCRNESQDQGRCNKSMITFVEFVVKYIVGFSTSCAPMVRSLKTHPDSRRTLPTNRASRNHWEANPRSAKRT